MKLFSVQSLSRVRLFETQWTALQASLSITNSRSSPKHMSIESVMPSSHLILCRILLLQHQGLFQWVNYLHEVAKVLEVQLQHQSLQWTHPGLISFRMDWLDLLVVQGTLKNLLQHDSSKGLECCNSWGHKESDTTEQLNWTDWLENIIFAPHWGFNHRL